MAVRLVPGVSGVAATAAASHRARKSAAVNSWGLSSIQPECFEQSDVHQYLILHILRQVVKFVVEGIVQ